MGSLVAAAVLATGVGLPRRSAAAVPPLVRQIARATVVRLTSAGAAPGVPPAGGMRGLEIDPGLAAQHVADGPATSAGAAPASVSSAGPATSSAASRAPVGAPLPSGSPWGGRMTNRSFARHGGEGQRVQSHPRAPARSGVALSFDGLSFFDQRFANGGNQFSVEPPDQGLCVGNGYVLETVNDVLRVFDTSGAPLTGAVDLNTFYGYPAAIDRATGTFGPSLTDPSCYFDGETQRWFHVVLTLDRVGVTSDLALTNHLDIAVSATASPLGEWNIYRVPVQDDGSAGTPVHASCPCLGDYPHIGADGNGFYVTTNEFPWAGGFNSAQIYAFSKRALVAGDESLAITQFDTADFLRDGNPGFTVWPAISSTPRDSERAAGGREYFLSSVAVFNDSGTDDRLRLWSLSHTSTLDSSTPDLVLSETAVEVAPYGVPPLANQRPGEIPLANCINDTTLPTPFGPGCWRYFFESEPGHDEVLSPVDANDSRMQQVYWSDGKLYGALDTVVTVGGTEQAGIAYYVIKPRCAGGDDAIAGSVWQQGTIGIANNNVTYPAIAATDRGAVMSFTLVGADHYPSAAFVTIDARRGAGPVQIAAEGAAPQDGLSNYLAFADGDIRPRWGDYGAAVSDGRSIWVASEYIGAACSFASYVAPRFGTCGGTRGALGNWGTRISKIRLGP